MATGNTRTLLLALGLALAALAGWLLLGRGSGSPGVGLDSAEPSAEPGSLVATASAPMRTTSAPSTLATSRDAATSAPGVGGLRLFVVHAKDETPAVAVHVRARERGRPLAQVFAAEAVTDAEGRVAFDGLRAGEIVVDTDRGHAEVVVVRAGEFTEARLVIPVGADATGVVIDAHEVPVPGAEVWLVDFDGLGRPAARTDRDGRFSVRSVAWADFLGARADGYAPSPTQQLHVGPGGSAEIKLVLPGRGGALEGRVLDREGRPVVAARVHAGDPRSFGTESRVLGRHSLGRTQSDGDGRFRVGGLAPGPNVVLVRAPGYAPLRVAFDAFADTTVQRDLVLGTGAALAGRVLTAEGDPVEDARLGLGNAHGELGTFLRVPKSGSFHFENLEAGPVRLRFSSEAHGELESDVELREGQVTRQDFAFPALPVLRGVLLDAKGAPLTGWSLSVVDEPRVAGSSDFGFATSGSDGRFTIRKLHDRTHLLEVIAPGAKTCTWQVRGVRPSGTEQEFRVPLDRMATARIRGRLLPLAGAKLAGTLVHFAASAPFRTSEMVTLEGEDGAFDLDPISPGAWEVEIDLPGRPRLSLGKRTLHPHETWDLGAFEVHPAGSLAVTTQPADAAVRMEVLQESPKQWLKVDQPLNPGAYRLLVHGAPFACRSVPFEIAPGQVTRLVLELQTAPRCTVRVGVGAGGAPLRWARVEIRPSGGAAVFDGSFLAQNGALRDLELGLAPGRYRIVVNADGDRRGTAECEVVAGAASQGPFEVTVGT